MPDLVNDPRLTQSLLTSPVAARIGAPAALSSSPIAPLWTGLPPAFIDVGSAETFRDEDVDYATKLWRAGGSAELHVWPGGFHAFANAVPEAAMSRAALAAQRNWLAGSWPSPQRRA